MSTPAGLAQRSNRLYRVPPHIGLLNWHLVQVAAGRITRLIIEIPVRHGKSELVGHYFPAWYLLTFPDRRVIYSSYVANLATHYGRQARSVVEEYGKEFGVRVRQDSRAAEWWQIEGREGYMTSAGVNGPITGKGGDIAIIDDPLKNDEEARSTVYRDNVDSWYKSTLLTRLEPRGAVIIQMSRWHQDDLVGRRLKAMAAGEEQWTVLRLPALAEEGDPLGRKPGEALWPERYSAAALAGIKSGVGSYYWNALYQQAPMAEGGYLATAAWFPVEQQAPPFVERMVRFWDLAGTMPEAGKDPDWTGGVKIGMGDGIFYILDVERFQATPGIVENRVMATARRDGYQCEVVLEQEGGSSGKAVAERYVQLLSAAGYIARARPSTASKQIRAMPFLGQCENGRVRMVKGDWNAAFLEEAVVFPFGRHDDQVDAAAGAFTELTTGLPETTGLVYGPRDAEMMISPV